MRKDAVVLEIRKKTAVVLASDGRFLRVRNQNYHAGQRIAETEQTPVRLRPMLRRTLLIAACLVLALGSSALAASKYMVWSYAGVDVGEISVNYTLNFRNEVLSAEGNSEEADQLIGSLERIPYEPIDSAVERMMDAAGEKQAEESEEPEVVICVASFMGGTERTEDRIMEGVDRSMEKAGPDEPRERRQEDVRVERIEWQEAGQFMEDRHHPQNIQNPAGTGEERQQPEEAKPEASEKQPEEAKPEASEKQPEEAKPEPIEKQPEEAKPEPIEKQPASQPTDAPQDTPATPGTTDEQPAQNSQTNPEKPENPEQEQKPFGQDQQKLQSNPPVEENTADKPAENETIPAREMHPSEDQNNDHSQPAFQDDPGKQPAVNPSQPSQPQFQQQQTPGSDNAQMNPGGQNRPDNGMNPPDKH